MFGVNDDDNAVARNAILCPLDVGGLPKDMIKWLLLIIMLLLLLIFKAKVFRS